MAMAAGRGTRMRPLTDNRCKAMVEVGGTALIDWTLDKLAAAGVEQAVVNVHHFADDLEALLAQRTTPEILISDERDRLLETGGGLVKAAPMLGEWPIFVANIDSLWIDGASPELEKLADAFDPERMDFLLMLSALGHQLGFDGAGDFFLEPDGRIRRRGAAASAPYAYAGVQVLHPRVLKDRKIEPFSTNRLWDEALAEGRVFAQVMEAFWMHVGDPAARDSAEQRLQARLEAQR
jgi:MurNAc alpha-1-phosphate uridylyltransferase